MQDTVRVFTYGILKIHYKVSKMNTDIRYSMLHVF